MKKETRNRKLSLNYIIRHSSLPRGKAPVVFMFHGFGSNKEDLFSFADDLPEEYTIISVEAPFEITYNGHAWYFIDLSADFEFDREQAKESVYLIDNFVTEACQCFNLNTERITLLGFSQGCILSQVLAVTFPEKYKRVIGLSGYLEESIAPDNFKNNRYDQVKMYISHGVSDQIVPFAWGKKSVETLRNCGVEVTFMEYPTAHGVSPQNYYSFRNWLVQNG